MRGMSSTCTRIVVDYERDDIDEVGTAQERG